MLPPACCVFASHETWHWKKFLLFSAAEKWHLEYFRHIVIKKWMWGQVWYYFASYLQCCRISSHQSPSCPIVSCFKQLTIERRISILRYALSDLRTTSAGSTQPSRFHVFKRRVSAFNGSPVAPALFHTLIKQTHPVNFPPLIRPVGLADACHVKSCTGWGFSLLSALCSVLLSPSRVGTRCRFCCVSSS